MKGSILFLKFYFLIFGCAGSSLLRTGISPVAAGGGDSVLTYVGFSLQWLLLLWITGPRVHALNIYCSLAPEHRFNSCGAQVYLIHGMWDLPGPGIKPMSPALSGSFFVAGPPGKPGSFL